MNYIILAAGMGTRLQPFTNNYPKCMLKIGKNETVAQRMIRLILKYDIDAEITMVVGFKHAEIEESLNGCRFIVNPFYSFTNSIASLWFARDLLDKPTTIINGDIVVSENLMEEIVSVPKNAIVLIDSSIKHDGDYNVQVSNERIVVMSKQLDSYFGEYAGITKLDQQSAVLLRNEICRMIDDGDFNEWYENALVQMILNSDFSLSYFDIADYEWTEVDSVNNLLAARQLQKKV
jgi:choline kinase